MEWLRLAIEFFSILVVNGAFFYTINRKFKKLELKEKEVDIVKKQDHEWQELYEEEKSKRQKAEEDFIKERNKRESADKKAQMLEMLNQRLSWYRCEINGCINRKPPHIFSSNGQELEEPQDNENKSNL